MNRDLLVICVVGLILLGGTLVVSAFPQKNTVDPAAETEVLYKEDRAVKPAESEKKDSLIKSKVESEPENTNPSGKPDFGMDVEQSISEKDNDKNSNVETISAGEISYIAPIDRDESNPRKQTDPVVEKPREREEKQPKHGEERNSSAVHEKQPQQIAEKKSPPAHVKPRNQDKWISREEAIAIATKLTPGRVVEVEYDDGEYEIEIRTDIHEVSYEIDARTGRILEKDIDDLDDDD